MIALNETTKNAQSVMANSSGRMLVESTAKYRNLGLVVSGAAGGNGYQLAAGADAVVSTLEDVEWVRYLTFICKGSAEKLAVLVRRISPTDDTINGATLSSDITGTNAWVTTALSPNSYGWGGGTSQLGKKAKITVRNTGTGAANFWLHAELMG
jgi:hypothetical protein